MRNYEVFLPSYSIGDKVYEKIKELCVPFGSSAVVIGGKRAMAAAGDKLKAAAGEADIKLIDMVWYGGECSYEQTERLKSLSCVQEADMIFAVGGGKALDTCKLLAEETGKTIFAFPTIASNCAACTTVSIMYREDGTFLKPHFYLHPAAHTFIDTQILAQAPAKYLWAGIGDTYAKYYEAEISSRGEQLEHFTAMGVCSSRMCLEPLLMYGEQAYQDNLAGKISYELEQTILAIVVSTAIASIFLTRDHTPDYNSGLAHAVFYAMTGFPEIEQHHLHGEVVSFGILILLLCDGQQQEYERIREFNLRMGLPVRLSDLGISRAEFDSLLEVIPDMSDVKHYPYRVTPQMLTGAISQLDH